MATRWKPDTCGCVVVFENTDVDDVFVCTEVENRCEEHEGIEDPQELFETVRAHNLANKEE